MCGRLRDGEELCAANWWLVNSLKGFVEFHSKSQDFAEAAWSVVSQLDS
jgi:hypothetical protein